MNKELLIQKLQDEIIRIQNMPDSDMLYEYHYELYGDRLRETRSL